MNMMTERQIDIMTNLSAWQRKIGFAQGVLEGMKDQAADRAASELESLSNQLYTFLLDLAMAKDGERE